MGLIFLDTSAIYALADASDPNHVKALRLFGDGLREGYLCHDYVLLESTALLQRRLGLEPALRFCRQVSHFRVVWVDGELYEEAVQLLETLANRQISLVDCMSFVVMRRHRLVRALAFDLHFTRQGFRLVE